MTITADLDSRRAERWSPPPKPRTHAQFARVMKLPDGPTPDERWDPTSEPMQDCLTQEADNDWWQEINAIASSQRGKSLLGVILILLRTLIELAQDAVYVMPTLEKLEQNWHGKLRPMIEKCGFTAWLPTKGPASKGGKPAVLVLRNPTTGRIQGRWYFASAGSGGKETATSSVTAQNVVVDEGDDFADEGHLSLPARRARSFGSRFRIWKISTINHRKNRDSHPIIDDYKGGTRSRLHYPCQHCQHFQLIEWENVITDGDVLGLRCTNPACLQMWSEADRKRSLRHWKLVHFGQEIDPATGIVTGPKPTTRRLSLLCWDLEFSRSSYEQVIGEYKRALLALEDRGDHELMRQFHYKVLCRDYVEDLQDLQMGIEMKWDYLLRRSEAETWGPSIRTTDRTGELDTFTYSRHVAEAPPAAIYACGAVDVQDNRVYVGMVAADSDGGTYDMAWSYEYARPDHRPWNRQELHSLLDLADIQLHRWAGQLALPLIALDTAFFTDDLMAWLEGKVDSPWIAIKGTDKLLTAKEDGSDVDGVIWQTDNLYRIHVDNTRALVLSAYRRDLAQPGAGHLPNGLGKGGSDKAYLQHLCGQQYVIDHKTGKRRLQETGRHDWLDTRRYCTAAIRLHQHRRSQPTPAPIDLQDWFAKQRRPK